MIDMPFRLMNYRDAAARKKRWDWVAYWDRKISELQKFNTLNVHLRNRP
jgi:hypothetical protein